MRDGDSKMAFLDFLYKNKANKGYCYIARKEDGTERYYNKDQDLMLDYIAQTINSNT